MSPAASVLHHVVLGLAVVALGVAALRVASQIVPGGILRALTAAVLGVAAAVGQALALGLAGLGASPPALAAAAALTCAAALRWVPAPDLAPADDLRRWWASSATGERVALAAGAGAALAALAWQLRHPSIGFDNTVYHYAEVAGWIENGRPGSVLTLSYDLPYGSYPLTDEVALTWLAGLARSFVPLSAWSWAMWSLLGAGAWATLRNVGAGRLAAGLGTAALLAAPMVVKQLNEPQTDVPALAWLACTAALCTATRRHPALIAPAIVAAGLAVGTKTTPVLLLAGALAAGVAGMRGRPRPPAAWIAGAVAGALVVGSPWYLRNLVEHGSPLWPFAAAPWGDPMPAFLQLVDARLVDQPVATLREHWRGYRELLAGGLVLLAGGLAAGARGALGADLPPALRRRLVAAGALTLVALVAFAAAPGTGLQEARESWFGPLATLRYVLPAAGAATVALALASTAAGATAVAAIAALGVASAWSAVESARLGTPYVPPAWVVLGGAVAGAALLAIAGLVAARVALPARRGRAAVAAVLGAVLAGVVLAPFAGGYAERHAGVEGSTALGRDLVGWFASQPGHDGGERTIAFASRGMIAALAGDHFTHPLRLVPAGASCAAIRRIATTSTVVVTRPSFLEGFVGVEDYRGARCLARVRPTRRQGAFTVYGPIGSADARAR